MNRRPDSTGTIQTRIGKDGVERYRVRLRIRGRQKGIGTFDDRRRAEAVLAAAVEEIRTAQPTRGITLRDYGAQWLERRVRSPLHRSAERDRSRWSSLVTSCAIADFAIATLTARDVRAWVKELIARKARQGRRIRRDGAIVVEVAELERTLGRQTVLNALGLVRACLQDALEEGHCGTNVARGIKVPPIPRTSETWTYLEQKEIDALLACEAIPVVSRVAFRVAIYAGLRRGELWGLRWEDVQLGTLEEREAVDETTRKRPELVICRSYGGPTKGGKPRRIPAVPAIIEALEAWRPLCPTGIENTLGLVFPSVLGGVRSKWDDAGFRRLQHHAGFARHVRFHDLRHTCAAHLISGTWGAAWSIEEVCDYLRHSSTDVTKRYAHLSPAALHRRARETTVRPRLAGNSAEVPVFQVAPAGIEPAANGLGTRAGAETTRDDAAAWTRDGLASEAKAALEAIAAGDPLAIRRAVTALEHVLRAEQADDHDAARVA